MHLVDGAAVGQVRCILQVALTCHPPSLNWFDQAVRYFRLEDIVENPDEALATDKKKGYAMRQASAILTFVTLE